MLSMSASLACNTGNSSAAINTRPVNPCLRRAGEICDRAETNPAGDMRLRT